MQLESLHTNYRRYIIVYTEAIFNLGLIFKTCFNDILKYARYAKTSMRGLKRDFWLEIKVDQNKRLSLGPKHTSVQLNCTNNWTFGLNLSSVTTKPSFIVKRIAQQVFWQESRVRAWKILMQLTIPSRFKEKTWRQHLKQILSNQSVNESFTFASIIYWPLNELEEIGS